MSADVTIPHPYQPIPERAYWPGRCADCLAMPTDPTFTEHHAEPDDDPEGFAAELIAEYASALERVRDRAVEARYGGRILRALSTDPKYAGHTPAQLLALAHGYAID